MKPFLFYLTLPFFLLIAACVTQEQFLGLENRVAVMERENSRQAALQKNKAGVLDQLTSDVKQDAKSTRENYAELKYEVHQLKERFYQVQGQMEALQHTLGTHNKRRQEEFENRLERLDNAIAKNYEKVIAIEKYMGFEPSEVTPVLGGQKDSGQGMAKDTEDGLYTFAKKLFDDGDRENARLQFENYINTYPRSKKAGNARFWIAECYYVEKWYEKAILEYQKVLETYPKSNKVAAARLKQGYAFAALGETANARLILKELIKRYPKSKEAKYAKKKLKSLK
ncbi:MAG: tol-pal system protein YbgF [Desulfobacterales bacterium]|nr:MAG: tol-pal system protein YbgF [Desulfobacterales bacterium]